MPFQKGHKFAKGGRRVGAGHPKKTDIDIKKAASVIAREFIEANVQPVLDTYLGLAAGQVVERITKAGVHKFRLAVDAPTTRHVIDKLLPDLKTDETQNRPIAIQVIVESAGSSGNGVTASGSGNGRTVLVVGE